MVYYTSRATLRVSLKILFAGYENKLFVKVLLNLFLGFITLKHCKINFCNTYAFFCMFLLKTAKFYKFEIAIYLHYCGRNFCRSKSQVNRKFQHSWRRISFLQKKIFDLQEQKTIIETNWMNSFHKTNIWGIELQK